MTNTGASASERLVLAVVRGQAMTSRAELTRLTGLPKTTVTGVVGRLLRRGVLVEHPAAPGDTQPGRGRPAASVALAAPAGRVGVLSLTHAGIRAAVAGFDGQVLAVRDAALDGPRDEQRVIDHALDLLTLVRTDAGVAARDISCAVLGIPAPFHRGVGVVAGQIPDAVRDAVPELPQVLGWLRCDPAPGVGRRLGVPATADNDANLGALGEATFGVGRGLDSFVYVKVVEGLGAGLVLGGQLYRGARGMAGELAHVQVRDDGPWCICGGRGCLAHSFGGFVTSFVESAYQKPLNFVDVLDLAALGEAGTRRILGDAGRQVGRVLADLCMMLCPEAIVVDGMLGAAAEAFLAGVREMIERHTPTTVAQTVRLVIGGLGDRAEILGAVALARREHLADQPAPAPGRR